MSSRVLNITFDALDPVAQAHWWAQVVDDFRIVDEGAMDEDEAELREPHGRSLEFIRVRDAKVVKNRMHVCLRPANTTRDAEVERIVGLGATLVADRREGERGWVVLADPEGNEFCVLATPADGVGVADYWVEN